MHRFFQLVNQQGLQRGIAIAAACLDINPSAVPKRRQERKMMIIMMLMPVHATALVPWQSGSLAASTGRNSQMICNGLRTHTAPLHTVHRNDCVLTGEGTGVLPPSALAFPCRCSYPDSDGWDYISCKGTSVLTCLLQQLTATRACPAATSQPPKPLRARSLSLNLTSLFAGSGIWARAAVAGLLCVQGHQRAHLPPAAADCCRGLLTRHICSFQSPSRPGG